MTTNAQWFAAAGQALYGDSWQQPTAALLSWPLDDRGQNRTIQRIAAAARKGEEYRINPTVLAELKQHLEGRRIELDDLIQSCPA